MADKTKYPVGTQSFDIIRTEGYLYIDKTMFIMPLMDSRRFVFLGRPRRFGKSLFLSTLEAFFSGRKELFEGLAVAEVEKEWKKYPVVRLDLSRCSSNDPFSFVQKIASIFSGIAENYGLEFNFEGTLDNVVFDLICRLHEKTGERVVLLVDEYDIPLHGLEKGSREYEVKQEALRTIFLQFKAADDHVKYCFVTGVARFNQVSLFSAPNNFDDISINPEFAALCGFTRDELLKYCAEGIAEFADATGLSRDEIIKRLVEHYDGYRFTRNDLQVFNPLSIMFALRDRDFGNYWVSTGLTSLFVHQIAKPGFKLPDITSKWYDADSLRQIYSTANPVSLMFQTGYLTIREYDDGDYRLRIPNREVLQALTKDLIPAYMDKPLDQNAENELFRELRRALQRGDVEQMIDVLRSIMASVAYHLYPKNEDKPEEKENYFHTMTYLVFMMVSSYIQCESASSKGRSDMVAQTDNFIYVFEFKVNKSLQEAFMQMDEKGYAARYAHSHKKVFEIAVVFSSSSHDIIEWGYRKR